MSNGSFSTWQLASASLRHYPKLMWPIVLGIAAATATILGALLVGDSLRGSLRFLAMDRIGSVDQILLAPNFFDASLLEIDADKPQRLILFPSTSLELRQDTALRRTSGVLSMGITPEFWALGTKLDSPNLQPNQIAINAATATELSAKVGDRLTMQIPAPSAVSSDNPLGKRDSETVAIANLELVTILPDRSIAAFNLRSTQAASRCAFVAAETIQNALSRFGQFNAAIYARANDGEPSLKQAEQIATERIENLPLTLADLGLKLDRIKEVYPERANGDSETETIFDYYQLSSDRLLLPDAVVAKVCEELKPDHTMPLLSYLANAISNAGDDDNKVVVPYSTIVGIEADCIGPDQATWRFRTDALASNVLLSDSNQTSELPSCLISSWLADDANLKVGDTLNIAYFLAENQDGHEVEKTFEATVAGIVQVTEPSRPFRRSTKAQFDLPPTPFNDPAMTPSVAGITDQDSISDWNTPFPLTRDVRSQDDDYWANYRLTPKLYLPLDSAKKLFGSRFGNITSIRIDPAIVADQAALESRLVKVLQPLASQLGWQVLPLRAEHLKASAGSTPFDGLFLALSFFVIVAALLLIFLLMRLSVESRSTQWGLLKASGWTNGKIRNLILLESSVVILGGCGIGVLLGVGFCQLVLQLLRGQWGGAVGGGGSFLNFHWSGQSLLIGFGIGAITALATIWFSVRFLSKQSGVQLLRQSSSDALATWVQRHVAKFRWQKVSFVVFLLLAIALPVVALYLQGPAKAGAFLGAGMCGLVALLVAFYVYAIAGKTNAKAASQLSLWSLAISSMRRNRLRSVLAVSLVAIASFLLLSVSLFHVEPDAAGTGGFDLLAISDLPISRDLNDPQVRENVLGPDAKMLAGSKFVGMRLRGGDDAGCSNLYQADQPRVLGVSDSMAKFDHVEIDADAKDAKSQFAWAGQADHVAKSIWTLLDKPATGTADDPIAVVIDQNTAMWGLHLNSSIGELFHYNYDNREVYFKTVGLLQNTVLQGYLIIGESNFKTIFPDISGRRAFLIADAKIVPEKLAELVERGWANEGLDAESTRGILQSLLQVQNTYLSAFQSLGALGLILGTLGLAVIQIRSVVERRNEFGVLQAIGFKYGRISELILFEHLILLLSGLAIGLISAIYAVALANLAGQSLGGIVWPLGMLVLVLVVGVMAGSFAVRRAVNTPVIEALRAA